MKRKRFVSPFVQLTFDFSQVSEIIIKSKRCPKCQRTQTLNYFYNDKNRKDGKTPHCKDCYAKQQEDYKKRCKERHMQGIDVTEVSSKRCPKCQKVLSLKRFNRDYGRKDGYMVHCKECVKNYQQSYMANDENRKRRYAQAAEYREQNREKLRRINRSYFTRNRIKIHGKGTIYRQNNKKKIHAKGIRYRTENAHKERLRHKIYRENNKDFIKASNHIYYLKNKHRQKLYREKWRSSPRGRMLSVMRGLRRRLRDAQCKGTFTMEQFYARCEYYGWCCYLCGKPLTKMTVEIEHRIPISRGGTNWPANLAPACRSCNASKHDKTELEYRTYLAKLKKFLP